MEGNKLSSTFLIPQRSHGIFTRRFLISAALTMTGLCYHKTHGHPYSAFTSTSTTSRSNRIQPYNTRISSTFNNGNVAQQKQSNFMGSSMHFRPVISKRRNSRTAVGMSFLGNDGGIFGIGAPEIAVTLLVGYFVLGPQDLYKLVKEIGKAFNTFKTVSADATKQFEDSMENTIELDELRNAQRELNDAFSFRRSINVDDEADPFLNKKAEASVDAPSSVVAAAAGTEEKVSESDSATPTKKRKKKRRRKMKKKVMEEPELKNYGEIDDLNIDDAFKTPEEQAVWEEDMSKIQKSRMERLEESGAADWFTASEETIADEVLSQQNEGPMLQNFDSELSNSNEQSRFASQLAGNWNEQIIANEDKLSPLSKIMDRLAILEEEKNAADLRIEEEFRLREELAETYYKKKRTLLEEAAAEVQADAYISLDVENTVAKTEEKIESKLEM